MQAIHPDVLKKIASVEDSLDELRMLLMANQRTQREGRELKDLRICVSAIARQLQSMDRGLAH